MHQKIGLIKGVDFDGGDLITYLLVVAK